MKTTRALVSGLAALCAMFAFALPADAALTLTAGNNATTTQNVATAITGFQIVGPAASTTPVQLRSTYGTLSMSNTTGLTFDGSSSGTTINFSGTVANINAALSTLTYSRSNTGSDTLEVSLVNKGEIFFTENNHLYKFVAGSYNWDAAKAAAEAQSAYGASGYLVTITSSGENSFVSQRLTGDGWIGASDSQTEGTWKWVTGPEAGTTFWIGLGNTNGAVAGQYSAWATNEPNQSGEEDCAETYVSSGTWNDFPCTALLGYVVEFGAQGNMPTVVAKNISITTADVPAVASLSPANGATSVSTTANLVLGLSKAVTAQTGNIEIRKASDDSLVEAIGAASGTVSVSGSSVTIDPVAPLAESTQYYVIVPGTAFKDATDNYFAGITGSSTWRFTTGDFTAPQITGLNATTSTSTVQVGWTTNEPASTKLFYSLDGSYASSTAETDTGTRVTSHSVSLSGLLACTTYHYRAYSRDAASNATTTAGAVFTTDGCPGGAEPLSATTTQVSVNAPATSTLSESGRSMAVQTPANFTATSSTVTIQIQALEADGVLGQLVEPAGGLLSAAAVVFDVKAIVNNTTVLDSFNLPVTVSYTYTDEDIVGIDEGSLTMFHYANGAWSELDNCSVNAAANTISCTAPHFSIFAIYGSPIPGVVRSAGGHSGGSVRVGCKDPNASNYQAFVSHRQDLCVYASATAPASTGAPAATGFAAAFLRDLSLGMSGSDVRALQAFLNSQGFAVAQSGAGSPGNETETFGSMTQAALAKFQAAHDISPAAGYFGPKTRAVLGTLVQYVTGTASGGENVQPAPSPVSEGEASFGRDLDVGMSGDDVRRLQELLVSKDAGPAAKALADAGVTGYFGAATRAAVAEWQAAHGISPAEGYFGARTRLAIEK